MYMHNRPAPTKALKELKKQISATESAVSRCCKNLKATPDHDDYLLASPKLSWEVQAESAYTPLAVCNIRAANSKWVKAWTPVDVGRGTMDVGPKEDAEEEFFRAAWWTEKKKKDKLKASGLCTPLAMTETEKAAMQRISQQNKAWLKANNETAPAPIPQAQLLAQLHKQLKLDDDINYGLKHPELSQLKKCKELAGLAKYLEKVRPNPQVAWIAKQLKLSAELPGTRKYEEKTVAAIRKDQAEWVAKQSEFGSLDEALREISAKKLGAAAHKKVSAKGGLPLFEKPNATATSGGQIKKDWPSAPVYSADVTALWPAATTSHVKAVDTEIARIRADNAKYLLAQSAC